MLYKNIRTQKKKTRDLYFQMIIFSKPDKISFLSLVKMRNKWKNLFQNRYFLLDPKMTKSWIILMLFHLKLEKSKEKCHYWFKVKSKQERLFWQLCVHKKLTSLLQSLWIVTKYIIFPKIKRKTTSLKSSRMPKDAKNRVLSLTIFSDLLSIYP